MVADTLLLRNPTTLIPRPTRRRCQSPPTSVRSVLPSGSNRRNPGRGGPLKGVEMDLARRMGSGCFSGRRARPLVEENSGGVDVMAAAAGVNGEGSPEHLVVMVNGIIGSKADWRYAAEQFVRRLPNKVIVHCSECNTSKLTFDGVDMMGERLANEILAVVKRWPQVQKISIVAHSLGGLIARYAIAKLYRPIPKSDLVGPQRSSITDHDNIMQYPDPLYESRIAGLEPINFITFATPHLGSKGNNQLPILCGLPFLEKRASQTAHLVAGRTGKHLFLSDGKDGKPPLLLQMVKDSDDLQFISALRAFKRRVAYANANYDHMVGWRTSSIRRQDELPKSNLLVVDQKYPHVVFVQRETAEGNKGSAVNQEPIGDLEVRTHIHIWEIGRALSPEVSTRRSLTWILKVGCSLLEEMINGLTQVAWERVDVSFRKSRQRYVAHTTIQVKTYWLNSDGADVVSHMIDNFLL